MGGEGLMTIAEGGDRGEGWDMSSKGGGVVLVFIDTIIVHANTLQKVMIL